MTLPHAYPESCGGACEGVAEGLTGESAGRRPAIEPRNYAGAVCGDSARMPVAGSNLCPYRNRCSGATAHRS